MSLKRKVPDESKEELEQELGVVNVLDEVRIFIGQYVVATNEQLDVMTLYAAATHGLKAFPAFGRLYFYTDTYEVAGKGTALHVVSHLSKARLDGNNSSDACLRLHLVQSSLANGPRTLYAQFIDHFWGGFGLRNSKRLLTDLMCNGHNASAIRTAKINRKPVTYSIFTALICSGTGNVLPGNAKSKTIMIKLKPGRPQKSWHHENSSALSEELSRKLSRVVNVHMDDLKQMDVNMCKLVAWKPLFAISSVLGGHEWLNRATSAFNELAFT
jgi:hypothetical protein